MSQIVHVQTTISTVFGIVDEDGNVIPQQPVQAALSVFGADTFREAHAQIAQERDKAAANYEDEQRLAAALGQHKATESKPTASNGNGNRAQRRATAKR